ncbi:hypothetical protein P4H65_03310 [Paenibacillus chitinolyticus]|uniref:hypothetical protein n=1 Tax=Paenibacillus chitinolyticus TaxID=79263 RepID=UPI002DB707FB|nr:hypothetical protein [Paenibacillus chitinolyticus]MEC0244846.1 hypothetical protein [Paenibacillus chitinolyticus]
MKTAVFTAEPLAREIVSGSRVFPFEAFPAGGVEDYDAVLLIGSSRIDDETALTREQCDILWNYVSGGGRLYAELLSAYDFSSSRLLGWKQDLPKSRRTMEKLRYAAGDGVLPEGSLLEWDGAMAYGFGVEAESKLEIGAYKDTRQALRGSGAGRDYPGLSIRKLGEGAVVYCAFSLFSSREPAALRPYADWSAVIGSLAAETGIPFMAPAPVMELSRGTTADKAVENSVSWFTDSGVLPEKDGSAGILENIHSVTARLSSDRRPDCHAHAALMFYLYGKASGQARWEEVSHNLLGYLFEAGYQDMDPESATYGFYKWFDYPGDKPDQIFTDDNAWVCTVLLYLYRRTGREEYRRRGLLVAEGLLATQHENGLRANVMTGAQLRDMGRERIAAELKVSLNPHFESMAHTAFIQAYLVTGETRYLDTAMRGSLYMLRHPDELEFMYSRTSGLTRFTLPLGYLAKQDETGEIAEGLRGIADYLLTHRHESGGIEEADNPDPDRFGLEDAGVYIHNGEGIADQLYTNNFLLMNAWEAWKATGDETYLDLYRGLERFLCRIQISSGDPRFHGGWMRALDLERMEYFGNNGDTGWGPYCIESGWTTAITAAGLLLGMLDETIFD